jgi:hypothetical protein
VKGFKIRKLNLIYQNYWFLTIDFVRVLSNSELWVGRPCGLTSAFWLLFGSDISCFLVFTECCFRCLSCHNSSITHSLLGFACGFILCFGRPLGPLLPHAICFAWAKFTLLLRIRVGDSRFPLIRQYLSFVSPWIILDYFSINLSLSTFFCPAPCSPCKGQLLNPIVSALIKYCEPDADRDRAARSLLLKPLFWWENIFILKKTDNLDNYFCKVV